MSGDDGLREVDAIFAALDNVGAFDHSNDEERAREQVAADIGTALAALRAKAAAADRVRELADRIEEDWEAVYADYEDDDTAAVIRRALDGDGPPC